MAVLAENMLYAGLNARFDKRSKRFYRNGWKYERTEFGGMFVKRRSGRVKAVAASLVMHAENWVIWDAMLRSGNKPAGGV